jgi:hypothetical protein
MVDESHDKARWRHSRPYGFGLAAAKLTAATCIAVVLAPDIAGRADHPTPHVTFLTWQAIPFAHAESRRERQERQRKERDDSRSDRPGSSASSGSSNAGSGSNSSPASASAPVGSAVAAPGASRANDANDRFGRETAGPAGKDDRGVARPNGADQASRALPESIRRMTSSRAARRDADRGQRTRTMRQEIVVVRPRRDTFRVAGELGMEVRQSGHGPSAVARLVVPDSLDIVTARGMLERALPGQRIGFNHVYRSYKAATDRAAPARGETRPASNEPCEPNRCFGPVVIKWREKLASCAASLRVGVIDTAVDFGHPAFGRKRFVTRTFIEPSDNRANAAHGTGVMALLAGQPGTGTPGLIPAAQFYVADVFSADAQGEPVTDTASLIEALDWMQRHRVRVINASVAGPSDPLLADKIRELARSGILVVAAAGNEGHYADPVYPAAYPEVIAVTAVDRKMRAYRRANHGKYIDVAAPGVDIWTALPNRQEGYQTGTSFAVPYVTALAATLLAPGEQAMKPDILKRLKLVDLGPTGRDPIYGLGAPEAPIACSSRAIASTTGAWSAQIMRASSGTSKTNFSLAGSD